ncbi:uncharacterized protein LOC100829176 isoform X2 [Brachypodium distachyon]|uniref:uncharacterized protein LOC100829176 isoform X2 n=1 Tax=Brachypodium distachyon TaxID=15368 RepID=UPI0001C71B20|nr:uncharacterized protein LOC100829176 isoform X2 [Brachypodium distachyon]|eukprot:XP_010230617.1 uncharacterized protein LOC100829176 isoform X2 [Brachypodium distachyon]
MARGADPDYIGSLLLMDGFDMGIRFDGFGENMKKIMELPIKYLDSAHDKAVGLVEDIQAMIYAPFPDDELPNEGQDPSSNSVVNGSSTTSVEVDQINSNEELSSSSSSLITAEDISLSTADNDPHETESVSSKNPDSSASEDTISLERTVGTKEEYMLGNSENLSDSCAPKDTISPRTVSSGNKVVLCNSENLSDRCAPEDTISLGKTVSSEDEIILWNPGSSVNPPQSHEQATIFQDYVSQEAKPDKVMQQVGLHSSGHSESSGCNGKILLGRISADGKEKSEIYSSDSPEKSRKHDLRDGEEQMKNNKAEASSVPQPKNASFKKIVMRSLSNKLRWSKKTSPIRPQDAANVHYEVISSSEDLEHDWELL